MSYLNAKEQKLQWSKGVRLEYTQILSLNITKEVFEFIFPIDAFITQIKYFTSDRWTLDTDKLLVFPCH
jgi:hypothetical protein